MSASSLAGVARGNHDVATERQRVLGIMVSAAIMLIAVWIAAPWRAPVAGGETYGIAQLAQAREPAAIVTPAPVSFLVRFRGSGPIARAQALAARGREAEAARTIQAQLARQASFSGLCFDRFTLGAAEVVLRSCSDVPAAERTTFQTRWLARLNAMRTVEYADANTAAAPMRAPG
jgi:hypothetical protein